MAEESLFVIFFHLPVQSQLQKKSSFELRNIINEKKKFPLQNHKMILQVDETKAATDHLSRLNNIEGRFDSIVGDSLVMTLFTEEIDIEYRNRFINISTSYYPGTANKVSRSFALRDILYINTRNPFRQKLTETGSVIMALSILTIVSSPFMGMNLPSEDRSSLRSEVFIIGVGGFLVSIPFFIFGKNKKYALSPTFRTKRTNYWALQQAGQ